ncbi:hypothetical protein DITRI_Ditri09bG0094500 [Diplodiscus trichospermus]
MVKKIRLSNDDLEKQRGAVMDKYRGNWNANRRIKDAHWGLMMEGSKNDERPPIGLEKLFLHYRICILGSSKLERDQMKPTCLRNEYVQHFICDIPVIGIDIKLGSRKLFFLIHQRQRYLSMQRNYGPNVAVSL